MNSRKEICGTHLVADTDAIADTNANVSVNGPRPPSNARLVLLPPFHVFFCE